jgi:hypothetical protein
MKYFSELQVRVAELMSDPITRRFRIGNLEIDAPKKLGIRNYIILYIIMLQIKRLLLRHAHAFIHPSS